MGKKTKFDSADSFKDDDLDLPDFGDSFDQPMPADDRTPSTSVKLFAKGAMDGVKDELTSGSSILKWTKQALPEGYGEAMDVTGDSLKAARDLYTNAAKTIKPSVGEMARSVSRLIPGETGKLKDTLKSIDDWSKDNETKYTEESKDKQREANIALALGDVFKFQMKQDVKEQAKDNAKEKIQQSLDITRHKDNFTVFNAMNLNLSKLTQYQDKVTSAYQKKSLELQYRSYFLSMDSLEEQKKYNEIFKAQLANIVKHTALPESVKVTSHDSFKDAARNKFWGSVNEGLFGGRNKMIEKFTKNISDTVMQKVSGAASTFGNAAMGLDQAGGALDMMEGMGQSKEETIGGLAGGFGINHYAEKAGRKVRGVLDKNKAVGAGGKKLQLLTGNIPEMLAEFKNSEKGDYDTYKDSPMQKMINGVMRFFKPLIPDTGPNKRIEKDDLKDLTKPKGFTVQTHKTINEIIPGFLARILREIQITRTNDKDIELTTYDFTKNDFTSYKEKKENMIEKVIPKAEVKQTQEQIDQFISKIEEETGTTLSPEAKKALGKQIFLDRSKGLGGSAERLSDAKSYKDDYIYKHADDISEMFRTYFERDRNLKRNDNDSHRILDKELKASEDYKRIGSNMSNTMGHVQNFSNLGDVKPLMDAGILNPDGTLNYKNFLELMQGNEIKTTSDSSKGDESIAAKLKTTAESNKHSKQNISPFKLNNDRYQLSDVTAKEDIQGFDSKAALNAVNNTPVYNWKYKQGKGDGGYHVGPMAQTVNQTMGNQAAPNGTKIDLVTLNGINTAAIQEVSSTLDKVVSYVTKALAKITGKPEEEKEKPKLVFEIYDSYKDGNRDLLGNKSFVNLLDKIGITNKLENPKEENKPEEQPVIVEDKEPKKKLNLIETINDVSDKTLAKLEEIRQAIGFGVNINMEHMQAYMASIGQEVKTYGKGLAGDLKAFGSSGASLLGAGIMAGGKAVKNIYMGTWNTIKKINTPIIDALAATTKFAGGKVKEMFSSKDIYVEGEIEPRMTAAKLKENFYVDAKTKKPITNIDDITGPVEDIEGKNVLLEEELPKIYTRITKGKGWVKSVFKGAGTLAKGAFSLLTGQLKLIPMAATAALNAAKWVKNTAFDLLDQPVDIYLKGQLDKPVMLARIMANGGYYSRKTNKPIMSPSKIDGAVYEIDGDDIVIVLTEEELKEGIVDFRGNPIRTPLGKLGKFISAGVGAAFKAVAKITGGIYNGYKSLLKGGKDIIGGFINAFVSGFNGIAGFGMESENLLRQIRDTLNNRLPGRKAKFDDSPKARAQRTKEARAKKPGVTPNEPEDKSKSIIDVIKDPGQALKDKASDLLDKGKEKLKEGIKKISTQEERDKTREELKAKVIESRKKLSEAKDKVKEGIDKVSTKEGRDEVKANITDKVKTKATGVLGGIKNVLENGLFSRKKEETKLDAKKEEVKETKKEEKSAEETEEKSKLPSKTAEKLKDKNKELKEKNKKKKVEKAVPNYKKTPKEAGEDASLEGERIGSWRRIEAQKKKDREELKNRSKPPPIKEAEKRKNIFDTIQEQLEARWQNAKDLGGAALDMWQNSRGNKQAPGVPGTPHAPSTVAGHPTAHGPTTPAGKGGRLYRMGKFLGNSVSNVRGGLPLLAAAAPLVMNGQQTPGVPNQPVAPTNSEKALNALNTANTVMDTAQNAKAVADMARGTGTIAAGGGAAYNTGRALGSRVGAIGQAAGNVATNGLVRNTGGLAYKAGNVLGKGVGAASKLGGKFLPGLGAAYGAYSTYDALKQGHYGEAALNGGLTLGSLAMTSGGLAGAGATAMGALGTAGSVLGGVGGALAGVGGAILGSPVILGALAVAATGYIGYKAYKFLTRNSTSPLDLIRYVQYGFKADDTQYVNKVFGLEQMLLEKSVYFNASGAFLKDKNFDLKAAMSSFGVSEKDAKAYNNWLTWFKERFKPVFLTHMTALNAIKQGAKLEDVDKLKPKEKLEYVKNTAFEEGPYSIIESPFPDLEVLPSSAKDVKDIVEKTKQELDKDVKKKTEDSNSFTGKVSKVIRSTFLHSLGMKTREEEEEAAEKAKNPNKKNNDIKAKEGFLQSIAPKGFIASSLFFPVKVGILALDATLDAVGDILGKGKLSKLVYFRAAQYGFRENQPEIIKLVFRLEELLKKNIIYKEGVAEFVGKNFDPAELYKLFAVSKGNVKAFDDLTTWFTDRFKPVYLTHLTALAKLANSPGLGNVDSLKDNIKLKYLELTRFEEGPYSVSNPPTGIIDTLTVGAKEVKIAYEAAVAELDPKKKTEALKATDLIVPKGKETDKVAPPKSDIKLSPGIDKALADIKDKNEPGLFSKTATAITAAGAALGRYLGFNVSAFEAVRFKTYGLKTMERDKVVSIRTLEDALIKKVKYDGAGAATFDGTAEDLIKTVGKDFGIPSVNSYRAGQWILWFVKRFLPVFLNFLGLAKQKLGKSITTTDEGAFKSSAQYEIATKISAAGDVWNVAQSPWDEYVLLSNAIDVGMNLKLLRDKSEKDELAEAKAPPQSKTKEATATTPVKPDDKSAAGKASAVTKALDTAKPSTAVSGINDDQIEAEDEKVNGSSTIINTEATKGSAGVPAIAGGPIASGAGGSQYIKLKPGENIDSLNPALLKNLKGMAEEYGAKTGKSITINSGSRTTEQQAALYKEKPGSAARPGYSMHEFGLAVDINEDTLNELDKLGLMKKYGFTRPVGGEPWHTEAAGYQSDIQRAKKDRGFATQAIQSSIGRGGGGYGKDKSGIKLKRNAEIAKQLYEAEASKEAPVETKDKGSILPPKTLDDKSKQTGSAIASDASKAPASVAPAPNGKGGYAGSASKVADGNVSGGGSASPDAEAKPKDSKDTSKINNNNPSTLSKGEEFTSSVPGGVSSAKDIPSPGKGSGLESVRGTIEGAAKAVGVDPKIMLGMAGIESSFNPNAKAPTSSASGLFQFIDDTWNETIAKYGKQYGYNSKTSPMDAKANSLMGAHFLKDNIKAISGSKPNPSTTDVYMAHFLGAAGANKFFSSPTEGIAAEAMPKQAKANRAIFYEGQRPRTFAEVYTFLKNKVNKSLSGLGFSDTSTQPVKATDKKDVKSTAGADSNSATTPATDKTKDPLKPALTDIGVTPTASTPEATTQAAPGAAQVEATNTAFNTPEAPKPKPSITQAITPLGGIGGLRNSTDTTQPQQDTRYDMNKAMTGVSDILVKSLDIQTQILEAIKNGFTASEKASKDSKATPLDKRESDAPVKTDAERNIDDKRNKQLKRFGDGPPSKVPVPMDRASI